MTALEATKDRRVGVTHRVALSEDGKQYLYADLSGETVMLRNRATQYAKSRNISQNTEVVLIPMYDDETIAETLAYLDSEVE